MAIKQKYPVQFAVVCNKKQRDLLAREAERRDVSIAAVVRDAVDYRYGLVDGREPGEAADADE